MATAAAEERQQMPELVLLRQISPSTLAAVSPRYILLKAWESPLPVTQFLSSRCAAARALLVDSFTPVGAGVLDALPSLGVVVTTSVGVNHIDLEACAGRGVAVASATGVFTDEVAEYAVGMLIDVLRRVSAADRYVRGGSWPLNGDYPLGTKLGGKNVGIIGLGSIGSEVAKRLEAFDCRILYTSRQRKASVPYPFFPTARDLASESDVLVVCCALTGETRHIVDGAVLDAMGKEGVVISVGRGPLIDEAELVRRLAAGDIAGAGLDVFEREPEVPLELLGMDNVVLSPHRSAYTKESSRAVQDMVLDNLEAFFSGRPLLNPVLVS